MKQIPLTQGRYARVDDEDYEQLSQWNWYYKSQNNGGYAARNSEYVRGLPRHTIRMHRQIMNTPDGYETDHINGDTLDNRRSNLRVCLKSENQRNRGKQQGTSQYKGIYWNKQNQRWHVQLQVDKKKIWLGSYKTEAEALSAYKAGAAKYHGEYARQP